MVAADQRLSVRQGVGHRVAERRTGAQVDTAAPQQLQPGVEANPAERHDHAHVRERRRLGLEMREAAGDLLARRLVVRGRAPHRRGDVGVVERQPVVDALRRGNVREAGAVERPHQEVAGAERAIAGENPARPVGAVRGGREAEDQQSRVRIAEAGHRTAPIDVILVCAALGVSYLGAVAPKAWAAVAGDDRLANRRQ